jgi:hypothetical protein
MTKQIKIDMGVKQWPRDKNEKPQFVILETGTQRAENHGGKFYYFPCSAEIKHLLSLN